MESTIGNSVRGQLIPGCVLIVLLPPDKEALSHPVLIRKISVTETLQPHLAPPGVSCPFRSHIYYLLVQPRSF